MVPGPVNVLQLLPALDSGGVERGTLEVGRHLAGLGHRSMVISAGGCLVDTLVAEGSEHYCWAIGEKSLGTLRLVPRLRRFLVENEVDIVHVRSRLPAWVGYLAWRRMNPATRPRLVSTFHGFYSVGRYSAIMSRVEHVIAVSDAIAEHVAQQYRPAAPVTTIHRGIDPALYPAGYRADEAWARSWAEQCPHLRGKRLLTLPGRISRLKGHADFIDLIARLKETVPDIHGLIVGGQEDKHRRYLAGLEQAIVQRGLRGDVTFTGHRGDLREIMSVSSLVVSLSGKPESFGRTVLEALAIGVPVVAYDHGGVGEILAAMLPSGRVRVDDRAGLYECCLRFLRQRPMIIDLPLRFTLSEMLSATVAVYGRLLADGRGRHVALANPAQAGRPREGSRA
ncbi:MAG TPA: glycosyl transferase [Candidatus Accumulibacter sp.]|nr:MAG: Spore coat protein SA [Candidatus Accumulibacter sp. SK-11]HAY28930.1 glycosyl transferase [Accumulibacter sp.]HCN68703.1 glycosyl transferase [Accumulibacter sp.]HCV13507.1 glycosyl transferase [Accumulibacter sp.]